MLKNISSIYSLLAATAILLLGSGLIGTVIALRAGMESFSQSTTGLIMSGFFGGYLVGSYLCPRVIRAVGHIRSFSVFAAIGCASILVHGLWVHPLIWLLLRLITGISMLGLYLVIESWLNSLSTNKTRGGLFAVYMTINLLALGCSQYLLLAYDIGSLAPFALAALFYALALVPIALTKMAQPKPVPSARLGLQHLYATSRLGVIGALVSGLVGGAFWGMGPVFALGAGFDKAGIALFMSGVIFGGALLQWPLGHWSDRHDRRLVISAVSLLAGAAALGVYFLVEQHRSLALLAAVLYGGGSFAIYSLSVAQANDHLHADDVLETTRGLLLLSGIGASIGPLAVGLLMQWFDAHVLMLYLATLSLMLSLFAWQRHRVGTPLGAQQQAEFVMMARTSSAVLELDPRVEAEGPVP